MGKSIKPKYRAVIKLESAVDKITSPFLTVCWDSKYYGRPNTGNAHRYLEVYNASLLSGGCNEHLTKAGFGQKAIAVKIETNEIYPETVAVAAL